MRRFARCSAEPSTVHEAYYERHFKTGLGYHVQSPCTRFLASRMMLLLDQPSQEGSVFPDRNVDDKDGTREAHDYVDRLMFQTGRRLVQHSVLNVERSVMYDIDQFFLSVDLFLDEDAYRFMVSTALGGGTRDKTRLQRVPFQQFMLLDALMTMVGRSGLAEHRHMILEHIKYKLGYSWMTSSKAEALMRLLSVRVVGHSVRRRMGKSVAVYASLARCLSFFPRAGIKGLYTVHQATAADDCHGAVAAGVKRFVSLFNDRQAKSYQDRIEARGGVIDKEDFYYVSRCDLLLTTTQIHVYFYRRNSNGDCNGGVPVSSNSLRCKGYTHHDVSYVSILTCNILP